MPELKARKMEIAVTFHFNENRLPYLQETARYFSQLADQVAVSIFTNENRARDPILNALKPSEYSLDVKVCNSLSHPFLLTFEHLKHFKEKFLDDSITHFLYLEDDICIRPHNINYWMEGRLVLQSYNLFPSFFRYETREDAEKYSTDCPKKLILLNLPFVKISEDYRFVNIPYPYQGMYLLDRELMSEHLEFRRSGRKLCDWDIREQATQGVTFYNVPHGYTSRNLLGVKNGRIDEAALVHHLPNNYANNPKSQFGKIRICDLFR